MLKKNKSYLAGLKVEAVAASAHAFAEAELLPRMREVAVESGVEWQPGVAYPGLATGDDGEMVRLAKRLARANDTVLLVFRPWADGNSWRPPA